MTRSGSVKHQRYKDRENIISKLENEFESMSEVINNYVEMSRNKDFGAGIIDIRRKAGEYLILGHSL